MLLPPNELLLASRVSACSTLVISTMELSHNLSNKMPKQEVYFSTDVMENILNRLPSTSIARFQIVSKYWCTVIRSFVLNAHSKSSLTRVQLSTTIESGELTHFNFNEDGKTINSIHKLNLGGTLNYNLSNMVNGLVCAYGRKTTTNVYLMNLTTFKTSYYSKRKIKGITIDYDQITLGLDPSAGLYKFIRIYSHNKTSSYHCEILEIGVLFKGDWKIIGEIPHKVDLENPVFFNGAIYWKMNPFWASSSSLNKRKTLVFDLLKLDMKEEKFGMVTPVLQNEVDRCNYQLCNWDYSFTLSEEKGKLYMLHYCCERKYLYGWRLKENRGGCLWNIVFQVDFASMAEKEPDCLLGRRECPYAVGIVDGKVLIYGIKRGTGAYIYDLVHKKLTKHWDVYGGFAFGKHCKRRITLFTSLQ